MPASLAAHFRLLAQLPRRRGTHRRDLHHHHHERPIQDRPRPRQAAQTSGRHDRVHLHPTGRVDKAVEFTYMEPSDKKRMAKRILGEYPDETCRCSSSSTGIPDLKETPAQFQERCGQIALKCFWNETTVRRSSSLGRCREKWFPKRGRRRRSPMAITCR